MRQAADEADRVGDEIPAAVVLEPAGRRVERLEEAVVDARIGAGERVQERGLADVRVAGERDRRRLASAGAPCGGCRAACPAPRGAPSAARHGAAPGGGRSPAATRPGRACRLRRRAARGAATSPASAAGCTRAARARPGACPRRCARAGRRCRGSAACGRRPAPPAGSRGAAAGLESTPRRRAATRPRPRRRHTSAPRACPCRRRSPDPGAGGTGRASRWDRRLPSAPARGSRRVPHRDRLPSGKTATTNPRSGSAPGAGSGWRWVTGEVSHVGGSGQTRGRPGGRPLCLLPTRLPTRAGWPGARRAGGSRCRRAGSRPTCARGRTARSAAASS